VQIEDVIKENWTLQETIDGLRTENEHLKKMLEEANREVQGLRQIVLCRIHGEEPGETEEKIKLPYSVRQRVVIFGGHDSWSKAIRPMLKNVRFVDKEAIPNAEMIKKADVIWLQTNAMPHKHYHMIMDVARAYGKEVRYFTSASAEKCARDVAQNDKKISERT